MNIVIEALMQNKHLRISTGIRWLVWDGIRWEVYEQLQGQRKSRLVYGGANFAYALEVVLE